MAGKGKKERNEWTSLPFRSQGGTMRHSAESNPGLAAGAAALRRLGRIDAVEPNALRPNPESVAVGDRRHT